MYAPPLYVAQGLQLLPPEDILSAALALHPALNAHESLTSGCQ